MMFEETDVEICVETCDLTNFSTTVPLNEITPGDYAQNNLEEKSLRGGNKTPLPIANPFIAAYLIVIVSAAVISNSIVLLVMGVRRKKLRTFQWCLISVCVSDLLFSLFLHPMSIATALGYDALKIFDQSGCLYFGVLALFFGSYDMVIHSLIAVLRYIYLCHPQGTAWFSKRTISILLLTCVFYSAIWCIGPIFEIGKYVTFEVGCTMDFTDDTVSGRLFVNCAFIFVFFIPLFITILSYVSIVIEVTKRRTDLEKMGSVSSSGRNRVAVEMKLVRLTSVIAAAYIIVWLPYAIVCLIETHGYTESVPWIFRILSALFCKTSCATNPLIYLFMSKGFRRDAIETLRYLVRSKQKNFAPNRLQNSSQKSSSNRSTSQISLRSWYSRTKKKTSFSGRNIKDNQNTSTEECAKSSVRRLETTV